MRDEGLGQHEDHRGGEEGHALKIKMMMHFYFLLQLASRRMRERERMDGRKDTKSALCTL